MTHRDETPTSTTPDPVALNRAIWDARTAVHVDSAFYDVPGFLAGADTLTEIEAPAFEDVAGERVLHLQCHFGLDTLSIARRGARVTGVDLSPAAIAQARRLAAESEIDATFVEADVLALEHAPLPDAPFDRVFASYGAICWIPDLAAWARVAARHLRPGGRFLLVEFHPIHDLLFGYDYFHHPEPDLEEDGTYTGDEMPAMPNATWPHHLGEVLTALLDAGIAVERFAEHRFSPYACFPDMQPRGPKRWALQHRGHDAPMVYEVHGVRR